MHLPTLPRRLRPALAALLTGLATALPAVANPGTTTPDATLPVHGRAMPAVLAEVCPDAASTLPDALAAAAQRQPGPALVRVSFELQGRDIRGLRAEGGSPAQALAVRRAVRGLDCRATDTTATPVRFSVRFVDPSARAADGAFARLEPR